MKEQKLPTEEWARWLSGLRNLPPEPGEINLTPKLMKRWKERTDSTLMIPTYVLWHTHTYTHNIHIHIHTGIKKKRKTYHETMTVQLLAGAAFFLFFLKK